MNIFLLKGITYSQYKIKYSIRWKILKKFAPFFRNWLPIYFGANIYLFKVVWAEWKEDSYLIRCLLFDSYHSFAMVCYWS